MGSLVFMVYVIDNGISKLVVQPLEMAFTKGLTGFLRLFKRNSYILIVVNKVFVHLFNRRPLWTTLCTSSSTYCNILIQKLSTFVLWKGSEAMCPQRNSYYLLASSPLFWVQTLVLDSDLFCELPQFNSELEESISERDKCTLRLGPENEIHDGQCDSWLKYYVCF